MPLRAFAVTALACALAAPVQAESKVVRVPSTGPGETLGIDPYVAEFQREWSAISADVAAMRQSIQGITVPPASAAGDVAAKTAVFAKYAAMGALMARAEAAHDKMLNHIMHADQDHRTFGPPPKDPGFKDKTDAAALKPQNDPTLRRSLKPSQAAAPAPRMAFKNVSSEYSYNSMGGGVGAGFNGGLSQTPTTGVNRAAPMDASYGPGAAAAPGGTTWGDPASVITTGAGTSAAGGAGIGAGGGGAGASVGATDSKPAVNPGQDSLSHSKSDVAEKAFERMQQKEKDAQARADQQRQDAEQARQQQQQMAMQAAQTAAQTAAQAAQNKNQNRQQPQNNGGGGGGQSLQQDALARLQQQVDQLQQQVDKTNQDAKDKAKAADQQKEIAVKEGQPAPADANAGESI